MTVLVDDAAWPWRGERWAHLVSDRDVAELHDFARRLGVPRLGFQEDHYDVPAPLRERALALGAHAVASRELVRALRAAGLRVRGPRPRWVEVDATHPDVGAALATVRTWWPEAAGWSWTTFLWRPDEVGLRAGFAPGPAPAVALVPAPEHRGWAVERGDHTIVDVVVPRA